MPIVTPEGLARGLGRRGALAALAAGALPLVARAQTPATPQIIAPIPPATTLPSAPTPAPAHPPTPAAAIDKSKIYYLFFDQAIDVNSMRALRRQLARLVEAGVTEITLVINSVGGLISQTMITYSFIRSLPAKIDTHAQGLVASAANILFLAGEVRSADRTSRFLFHPSVVPLAGALSEQQVQEQLTQVNAVESMMAQIYQDRTRLTEQEVKGFNRGEVIYTPDAAQRAGIIQTVSDLAIPGDQKARILFLD